MRKLLTLIGSIAVINMALSSCDTPYTMAWGQYNWAKDTLEAGDPYCAKRWLERCNKDVDSVLAVKVDSLMKVIDKAIEEDKKNKS